MPIDLTQRPLLHFEKAPLTPEASRERIVEERIEDAPQAELTVLVVAFNERDQLLNLLRSLVAQADARVRVLVVDNGIDHDIRAAVQALPVDYVRADGNAGCCGGRNIGAGLVSTPLIAFLDADAEIEDDYLESCFAVWNDGLIAVRGRVRTLDPASPTPTHYDLGEQRFPAAPTTEGISIWDAQRFIAAGGFEESLYGHEGAVLAYRMTELFGARLEQFVYDPRLVLLHDFTSPAGLESKALRSRVLRWHVDRKYPLMARLMSEFSALEPAGATPRHPSTSWLRAADAARAEINATVTAMANDRHAARREAPDTPGPDGRFAITVVIPCYNLHRHVARALRSVERQTVDSVEIIIVNDASPDPATAPALDALAGRARIIHREVNGGASAARNTGVAAAKSDIVLCLDADDAIAPTYLEDAVNVFALLPHVNVVGSNVKYVGRRTGLWRPRDRVDIVGALAESPFGNASVYRRSLWEAIGGYDEDMRGYEDWEFWIRALALGGPARIIPMPHYRYTVRAGSKVETSNRNAADIVAYITQKHQGLYREYASELIVTKHLQVVAARARAARAEKRVRELELQIATRDRRTVRAYLGRVKTKAVRSLGR